MSQVIPVLGPCEEARFLLAFSVVIFLLFCVFYVVFDLFLAVFVLAELILTFSCPVCTKIIIIIISILFPFFLCSTLPFTCLFLLLFFFYFIFLSSSVYYVIWNHV